MISTGSKKMMPVSGFGGDFVFLPALGFNMNLKSAGIISGEGKLSGANLYGGIGRGESVNILYLRFSRLDQMHLSRNTELKSFTPTRLARDNLEYGAV